MGFHVGQQVVCIDADDTNSWQVAELKNVKIYTLRDVVVEAGEVGVRLHGVSRTVVGVIDPRDTPFFARRFRPLEDHRMEQFRVHLAPVRQRERA